MFDLAIIVKMPPPKDESMLGEKWLPRYDEFASRTAEVADRLADQFRAHTTVQVRRGGVAGGGYAWPEWPDAVPHPVGLPPIDVGQAIYLRDALVGVAALATITKVTYDFVKQLRKASPATQGEHAPHIVLEIHIRNGDVIDTSTTTPADAHEALAAATRHWQPTLPNEELERIRQLLAASSDADLMQMRRKAEERVGSLLWDIWYREDAPLDDRLQALRRLFESFRDIEIAIDNAQRAGGESP